MGISCCFIREQFFIDHSDFTNMLDPNDTAKNAHRKYLCLNIEINDNQFLIPLRNQLGEAVRKFGRIGHAVPTPNRELAGLDYRHALIVNDEQYIERPNEQRIPNSQYRLMERDIAAIEKEFEIYLTGFLKTAKKNRLDKTALYRDCSLVNFRKELNI